jgi:probable HAF family extracellular repeat protein
MDLHTLSSTSDSTTSSVANAVNDSGQVVGSSGTGDFVNGQLVSHAFLWTQADGMRDLGTLGGIRSSATAINASGWIVGNSDTGDIVNGASVSHAFLWTQTHGMLDLGTLPSGTNSRAMAVNANGDILGQSDLPASPAHAVLWPSRCWERPNTFIISGQVTALKGGSPIPGAAVRVIQIDAGVPGIITSVTDSAGFYSITFYRGSYDGRYSVTVFTSGFEDMSIVIDKIDNGAVITKDFPLGRIGVLKGMVTDTNAPSVPLAGAGVLVGEGVPVVGQPKTFKFSTHTDSAGKYSIMIEPHGAYKALAFQPGFNDSPPADITINTDDETPQNFALSKAMTGNITGIVQDADSGDLLENATVVATGVDPPSQSIMTDTSAGAYTLSNVPAGRYQVAAGARGYAEGNEIVKVIASQTVTASFELVRKRRR